MPTNDKSKDYDGSEPLDNPRWELFCQLYAGECLGNGAESYRRAGYDNDNAEVSASRLLTNGNIVNRVSYIRKQNEKKMQMTKDEALAILAEIARAKITDFMDESNRFVINGKPKVRAVASIKVKHLYEDGEHAGTETECRIRDPRDAIETMAKLCGWNEPEKIEATGSLSVSMTPAEAMQHLMKKMNDA